MKINHQVSMDTAQEYPFCFVRCISSVYLGTVSQALYSRDEILEARFFDADRELRVFRDEDGALRAVELTVQPDDHRIKDTYVIDNARFGRTLTVRRILDADEDGQTYVKASCLCGWEGGTV